MREFFCFSSRIRALIYPAMLLLTTGVLANSVAVEGPTYLQHMRAVGGFSVGEFIYASDATTVEGTGSLLSFDAANADLHLGGSDPDGDVDLYIEKGSSGLSSFNANADNIVINGSNFTGMTFASPNNKGLRIAAADPQSGFAGVLDYLHTTDEWGLWTSAVIRVGIGDTEMGLGSGIDLTAPVAEYTLHGSDSLDGNAATDLIVRGGSNPSTGAAGDLLLEPGTSASGSDGNVAAGLASIATTATDGFLYVPACSGTPTGTPTGITGMAPIVVDSTNNKIYFYSGGAWRDAGP